MSEAMTCPKCATPLPSNAPAGICPKCLIGAGLSEEPNSAVESVGVGKTIVTPPSIGFVPPALEELAPYFPQLELLELLGRGGMGAVYKARQTKLDRLVALKIINPETAADPNFAERFVREARTLARLSHPHIVGVHDFGEADVLLGERDEVGTNANQPQTLYYFVMEYVDGANLRHLLESGELRPDQALAVVPQVCEALQFAHDEGVVHRDIKPENILVDTRGRVKIADFGLARLVDSSPNDFTLTGTHQVMGTPRYMAPEQMTGSHSVDHRADIYSLGVVFYELLTGEVPMGRFEPPSKVSPVDNRLDDVVLRALAREPDRRFQQASELKTSVELISSQAEATDSTSPFDAEPPPPVGFSTIAEREFQNVRRWIAGKPSESTHERLELPYLTMVALSLAGCAMVAFPWLTLEISQATVLRGLMVQLDYPESQSIIGTTLWPGLAAAAAFASFALVLFVTSGKRRLSVGRAITLTLIAGVALAGTLLFKGEVSNRRQIVSVDRESSIARWPKSDVERFSKNLQGGRQTVQLRQVHHQLKYQAGFYGSLGLSLGLLLLSAIGVRHAFAARPTTPAKEKKKKANLSTAPPIATLRFAVPNRDDVGERIVFHFSGLGYHLADEEPGVWVFQRGSIMGSVAGCNIHAFQTVLTVRTTTVKEGERLVGCVWSVKSFGNWVSKRDIRKLEAEGQELRTFLDETGPAH